MTKSLDDVIDEDVAKEKKEEKKAAAQSTTGKEGEKTAADSPAGTMAADGEAFFEGEILAYRELNRIAEAIASLIGEKHPKLIVYNKRNAEALPALDAFRVQARWIRDQYREIPSPALTKVAMEAATATLVAATTLAKGFLDFLALFRSDVEVHGRDFTLDELALIAELAHHLGDKASIIYPTLEPLGDAVAGGKSGAPENSSEATEDKTKKPAETIWTLLQEVAGAKGEARQRSQGKPDLEARVDVIDSQFNAFLQGLMKPDATSGATLLTTLARAEALQASLQDGQILFVKIVRSGVGRRLLENFWTRTFFSDRISYSGGAVVTFMILDRAGKILLSRTLYSHSGYTKFNQSDPRYEEGRNFKLSQGQG